MKIMHPVNPIDPVILSKIYHFIHTIRYRAALFHIEFFNSDEYPLTVLPFFNSLKIETLRPVYLETIVEAL